MRLIVPCVFASLCLASIAHAQCVQLVDVPGYPGLQQPPFGGVDGPVEAITTWDPDGPGPRTALVVTAGNITRAGRLTGVQVAGHDYMGSRWYGLGGLAGTVYALGASPQHELFAGGTFGLARWNGTSWTPVGSGLAGEVRSISFSASGDLLVAGTLSLGSVPQRIAMFTGGAWQPLGGGIEGNAYVIRGLSDGTIAVGGDFNRAGGLPAGVSPANLAVWTGATWTTLAGASPNGPVHAIERAPDGSIVIGGSFTDISGVPASRIARLVNGTWFSVGAGVSNTVLDIAAMPDGSIYAAGLFPSAGSVVSPGLARAVPASGSGDAAYSWENAMLTQSAGTAAVEALVLPDGLGAVAAYGGAYPASQLVRNIAYASPAPSLYAGPPLEMPLSLSPLWTSGTNSDQGIGFARSEGFFSPVGAFRLAPRGDQPLGGMVFANGEFSVSPATLRQPAAIRQLSDGRIRMFAPSNGQSQLYDLQPDGSWASVPFSNSGFSQYASVGPTGEAFVLSSTLNSGILRRWSPVTERWATVAGSYAPDAGQVMTMRGLASDAAGNAFLLGTFTQVNGQPVANLARWNGVWSATSLGADLQVFSSSLFSLKNGKVVLAEVRTGGAARVHVFDNGAWVQLGQTLTFTGGASRFVERVDLDASGNYYIVGTFGVDGGPVSRRTMVLRNNMWQSFPFEFRRLFEQGDGSTLAVSDTGLVRIQPGACCDDIDFNNDDVFPDTQDVLDLFTVVSGGPCSAGNTCNDIDFNNNGVFPEDQDIIDFFNVLAGGQCL